MLYQDLTDEQKLKAQAVCKRCKYYEGQVPCKSSKQWNYEKCFDHVVKVVQDRTVERLLK